MFKKYEKERRDIKIQREAYENQNRKYKEKEKKNMQRE